MFILLLLFLLSVVAVQARYVYVPPPAPMCYGSDGQEVVCPASKEVVIITVCSVLGGISLIIGFAILFYRWKRGQRSLPRNVDTKENELRQELLHPMERV